MAYGAPASCAVRTGTTGAPPAACRARTPHRTARCRCCRADLLPPDTSNCLRCSTPHTPGILERSGCKAKPIRRSAACARGAPRGGTHRSLSKLLEFEGVVGSSAGWAPRRRADVYTALRSPGAKPVRGQCHGEGLGSPVERHEHQHAIEVPDRRGLRLPAHRRLEELRHVAELRDDVGRAALRVEDSQGRCE